jgi:hypothetical protein
MSLKVQIQDPRTGLLAEVVDGTEPNALVVATRPLKQLENFIIPFLSSRYGLDMNQDASTGGTPFPIHDGTDADLWTGSSIVGNAATFNSEDQAYSGTKSVLINNAATNDIVQFYDAGGVTPNNYEALSVRIYVDKEWSADDDIRIYAYDTGTELKIGNDVSLRNYFSWGSFGVWHKILIPMVDFESASLGSVDAWRIEIITRDGPGPKFYIDELQLEETSGIGEPFIARPAKGTKFHVTKFIITIADVYTGGSSFDKIGDLATLPVGLNFATTSGGSQSFTTTVRQFSDLYQLGFDLIAELDDGVNTFTSLAYNIDPGNPISLDSREEDNMATTINDDLTGLLYLRTFLQGNVEKIL